MIGSARRADLLECRRDTMEIMREALEKLKFVRDPKVREPMLESIKELGKIAKEYQAMIEYEDVNGVPEKWVSFYKIQEQLHARNQ